MDDLFYDVPCGIVKSKPHDPRQYRVLCALFSCPFEAMSFAHRNRHNLPSLGNLCVNRRPWNPDILAATPVLDYRKESN